MSFSFHNPDLLFIFFILGEHSWWCLELTPYSIPLAPLLWPWNLRFLILFDLPEASCLDIFSLMLYYNRNSYLLVDKLRQLPCDKKYYPVTVISPSETEQIIKWAWGRMVRENVEIRYINNMQTLVFVAQTQQSMS